MPRNASTGVYTAPSNSFNPAVPGTTVSSTAWAAQLADYSTALAHAASTTRALYPTTGQIQDGAFVWGGTAGGSANALTISLTPALTAYATGQRFSLISNVANTGAATLSIDGLAAKSIRLGASTLSAGAIPAATVLFVVYDGTYFRLVATEPTGFGQSLTTTASATSGRTLLNAAPLPTTTPGVAGSWQTLDSGSGSSLTAPADGNWVCWWFGIITATGAVVGVPEMGEVPGGTRLKAGSPGVSYYGWAWRTTL